jgi:hypothetical protein
MAYPDMQDAIDQLRFVCPEDWNLLSQALANGSLGWGDTSNCDGNPEGCTYLGQTAIQLTENTVDIFYLAWLLRHEAGHLLYNQPDWDENHWPHEDDEDYDCH